MEEKRVALYHKIMRRENFETAAKDLFQLLISAQKTNPNQPRVLYVDIDGHRDENGNFDRDMTEIQNEFGCDFLLPYFTEVHFPAASAQNPEEQNNVIPDSLDIHNPENRKDDRLDSLYIENYTNTEFMSEEPVYAFLRQVSTFLKKYSDRDLEYALLEREPYDPAGWLLHWRMYAKDLILELFNQFIYGNLISVSAMTRSLIECCVYLRIIKREQRTELLDNWFFCSVINGLDRDDESYKKEALAAVSQYCEERHLDFEDLYRRFSEGNENSWLSDVESLYGKRVTFRRICDSLGDPDIYRDFQTASPFVHRQDILSKLSPFVYYSSICQKLVLMMIYSFQAIRLFPIDEATEAEIRRLEQELTVLKEKYIH